MSQKGKGGGQAAFLWTVIILAMTLRMTFTGVGTLLPMMQESLGVSGTAMGLLNSAPLLLFAVVSPLAAAAGRRLGMGRTILLALALILLGVLIRSYTNTAGLFIGTAVMACGIGAVNVLSLALIKLRAAPGRAGMVTSVFSATVSVSACVAVSVSVPLALTMGWRNALAIWALPVALSIAVWGVQHRRPENQIPDAAGEKTGLTRLLRSPLAWQVTVFVGAQSLIFYCITGWFPTILQSRGFSDVEAGAICSVLQIVTIPASFAAPVLCARLKPALVMAMTNAVMAVGLGMFILASGRAVHYAALIILGAGIGALFSMSNLCYSLCTKNAADTAALSGMANCAGYLIAAVGPAAMGRLFDLTRSWTPSLIFLAAAGVVNIVSSQLSTRGRRL